MEIHWKVHKEDHHLELRQLLERRLGFSRLLLKRLRLYGHCTRNGQPCRMIDSVFAGDDLHLYFQEENELSFPCRLPASSPVSVLYEDDWLIVADKPAHLVTHPDHNWPCDSLLSRLGAAYGQADAQLHPVSRLDRDTSGLVLVAKHGYGHYLLSQKRILKHYVAFVHGRPPAKEGWIQLPIARKGSSIIEREVAMGGQPALTQYQLLSAVNDTYSWLHLHLWTGRTHQLRVHLAAIGCPIVGDTLYGHRGETEDFWDRKLKRQALHAHHLALNWSLPQKLAANAQGLSLANIDTEELCFFAAPLPLDMQQLPQAPSAFSLEKIARREDLSHAAAPLFLC